MSQIKKIRWLIAHEPIELFLRTAEAFSNKLAELTDNRFEVEIYTVSQYIEKFGDSVKMAGEPGATALSRETVDPIVNMEDGTLEMSQLHISELAQWHNPNFYALEMPFLFRDHDHARTVLEGDIGRGLLNSLRDNSPTTGLAFTYSGGFRCVASEQTMSRLEDFKDCKFSTSPNPVTIDMIRALGGQAQVFHIRDWVKKFREEGYESDVVDTTIPRYLAVLQDTAKRNLLNTKHNLFLTTIIASNQFLSSLSVGDREAIDQAVLFASRAERAWSVKEAEDFAHEDHEKYGINYAELSADETEKFKDLVKPMYEKYKNFFQAGLIDGIIKS